MNASPNENSIGRPMKCDKEAIVGFAVAFEKFIQLNDENE